MSGMDRTRNARAPGATGAGGNGNGQSLAGDLHAQYTATWQGTSSPRPQGSRRAGRGTPVYTADGRPVAHVTPAGVLVKYARASRHFLRQPPAIAFDVTVLEQARTLGAWRIVVKDREDGRTYTASMETITARGFQIDRGAGAQWAVPLKFWHVSRARASAPDVDPDPSEDGAGEQLTLWGRQ